MKAMKQRLRQALSLRQKRYIVATSRVSAAVLLPIYYKHGQYYILFTKRTEKVKEHKGEMSFPGGAYQEGDGTLVNTALRECAEEIGLMTDDIEVLGELDDTVTLTSGYIITPFVALIPSSYQFQVNREEIEEIIEVPVSALLENDCLCKRAGILEGKVIDLYYYHYKEQVIWGATARILNQLLGVIALFMESKSDGEPDLENIC